MGNDLSIDQLCAECPELRDEVEQKIEALKRMAWMSGDAEEPPLPEVIVGRYKVEHLLGQGGHGRVVLAFDTELERRVAIKIPHSPLVELKTEPFTHENLGQLNTYLNWYAVNEQADDDNPPVGILLCTNKNDALVKYAVAGMDNQLFVSRYQVALPDKDQIAAFIESELKNAL